MVTRPYLSSRTLCLIRWPTIGKLAINGNLQSEVFLMFSSLPQRNRYGVAISKTFQCENLNFLEECHLGSKELQEISCWGLGGGGKGLLGR